MNDKPRYYIAYGSNLNLEQMAYRCPTAKVVGVSEIKDYQLVFRGNRYSAVATIEPKEGARVPVLIWDIERADEWALDKYEGFPSFYAKEDMNLEIEGTPVKAMVYIMGDGYEIGIPSQRYFNIIKEGYQSAGFDEMVLNEALDFSRENMDKEIMYEGFRLDM